MGCGEVTTVDGWSQELGLTWDFPGPLASSSGNNHSALYCLSQHSEHFPHKYGAYPYLFISFPYPAASPGRPGAMSVPFITKSLASLGLAHGQPSKHIC